MTLKKEAWHIINIFKFMGEDSFVYISKNYELIDSLFDSVMQAIVKSSRLKNIMPKEFVYPALKYLENDLKWKKHFENKDHKSFFLSDLMLFFRH
ncbi:MULTISPECIES: hypothetical protein [unclassified Lebetimonas]|uniref:hypothetical protein n=1 Tax=unclassified Lebetimonas TaxID=2648158 RepID=UPI0004640D87|nr:MULTISPECIES: hypothetical protein [unclassified Lebetimonas]